MGPIGAIIMSSFAFVWTVLAIIFGAPVPVIGLIVPFLISVGFIVVAVRQLRGDRPPPSAEDRRIGKVIMWASAAEGFGFLLIFNLFDAIGLSNWKLAGLAIIVGLHFIPIGWVAKRTSMFLLAAALIGLGSVGLALPYTASSLLCGVGAAVALWIASASALSQASTRTDPA